MIRAVISVPYNYYGILSSAPIPDKPFTGKELQFQ
jgi:hypothetical protein